MPLINYETNLMLTWSADCAISGAARATKLIINHAKFYIAVVTWSTQVNTKFLQQLKSGFKHVINWININKKKQPQNQNFDFLIDPNFHGVNRL